MSNESSECQERIDQGISDINDLFTELNTGNTHTKSACVKCRKTLMSISKICKSLRADINEKKKSMTRRKKTEDS